MARGLVVFLLLCLNAQPVFALSIDWEKRMQRFSRYVSEHSLAQGRRTRVLEVQSMSFNSRVEGYVRALWKRGHVPFKSQKKT